MTESTDATKVVPDSMDDEPSPITEAPTAEILVAINDVNNLPIFEVPTAIDVVNCVGRLKGTTNDQIRESKNPGNWL